MNSARPNDGSRAFCRVKSSNDDRWQFSFVGRSGVGRIGADAPSTSVRRNTISGHPVEGRDPEALLHAEAYTEEELSSLVGIGVDVIRRAARGGQLRARVVNDEVISIQRDDALEWMRTRP